MAASPTPVRLPPELLAAIDAEASRSGRKRSAVIVDILAEKLMGSEAEPERAPPKARAPKAPVPADPRAALAQAEAKAGVAPVGQGRGARAMEAAGVMVFSGGKRPAYQKGGGAQGKAKGR